MNKTNIKEEVLEEKYIHDDIEMTFFEHDMCTFVNMRIYNMSYEDAQKKAIRDVKEAKE